MITKEFSGLAMTFDKFTATSGRRCQFTPSAFNRLETATESQVLPVWVHHRPGMVLNVAGGIRWTVDLRGLWCRFSLDQSTVLNRAVILAIHHGHLTGLSLGFDIIADREIGTPDDPCSLINAMFARELSVVNRPACRDAFIVPAGSDRIASPSMPSDPLERRTLLWLLNELEIDHEPTPSPKTTVASTAFAPVNRIAGFKLPATPKQDARYISLRDPRLLAAISKAPRSPLRPPPRTVPRPSAAAAAAMTDQAYWDDYLTSWIKTNRPNEYARLCRAAE